MNLRQHISRLATFLTKKLRLDVRFYGRSFGLISLGHTSAIIRGIATTFLMARWLPRNTMGEFRYILALFGIASIFSLSGLNISIIRGIAKGDTGIARAALKLIFLISPLGSVGLALAAWERWAHGETHVATGLLIAGLIFPLYSVSGLYGAILTGKDEIRKLTKIAVANNVLFALLFFAVILNTKELLPVLVAYFGFDVLIRGWITWREVRRLKPGGNSAEHLLLGKHLSAIGAFQVIAMQLDQVLIQRFFGYGSLANYSIAILIPEQIKDFINSISGIVLRRFSRHKNTPQILQQTKRHFWTVTAGSGILALAYIVVAPFILPWLFPQYQNQILPSIVYALGLTAMSIMVGVNFMQANNQIRRLWIFYIANTVLQIGSNLALVPFFGSWGAILSKTVTRLISAGLSYPRFEKSKDQTSNKS
jgi:O-antigen/teichoic acid export membrane protein